jgi:hypothetical protein
MGRAAQGVFDECRDLAPDHARRTLARVYARGDRFLTGCILFHVAIAISLADFYSTWPLTLIVCGAGTYVFLLSKSLRPGSFLTRTIASIVLQSFAALHVWQLHGLPEMRLYSFTALAMMMVYQDWRCLWPGTILMMVLHYGFAVLHNSGYEIYFFEEGWVGLARLWFQFGISLVAAAICGYWARVLCGQTLQLTWQQLSLERAAQELRGTKERLQAAMRLQQESEAVRQMPMADPDAARAVRETEGVLKRLGAALGEANSSVEKAGEVERP